MILYRNFAIFILIFTLFYTVFGEEPDKTDDFIVETESEDVTEEIVSESVPNEEEMEDEEVPKEQKDDINRKLLICYLMEKIELNRRTVEI